MEAALAKPRPDHGKKPLEQKTATFNDLLANLKKVEQRQPFNGERIPRPVASIDPEDLSRPTYEQTIRGILADLDAKSSALKRKSLLTFPPQ